MARPLKSFTTDAGFYELAIAAPSMKAALQAWGLTHNAFANGSARQSRDPAVIAATTAQPGVVLRRPIGGKGVFKQQPDLPNLPAASKTRPVRWKPEPDAAKIRAAQTALEKARAAHARRAAALQNAAAAAQNRIANEDESWRQTREKLEAALERVRKPPRKAN